MIAEKIGWLIGGGLFGIAYFDELFGLGYRFGYRAGLWIGKQILRD